MEDIVQITSFEEFRSITMGPLGFRGIFRGVPDQSYDLIPSIGRLNSSSRGKSGFPSFEKRIIRTFKKRAQAHMDVLPSSEIEWLALAQHHGLPTRLLDWSYNPLVALFFAVSEDNDTASAVYLYRKTKVYDFEDFENPRKIKKNVVLRPVALTKRIVAQKALFTLHANPQLEFTHKGRITKLIIPTNKKNIFRATLKKFGVGFASLFPDLDGLSKEIIYNSTFLE